MFTLILIASHFFITNLENAAHTLPPQSLITSSHSIRSPKFFSPLNDYGFLESKLCYHSMIMAPMDTSNLFPLIMMDTYTL